MAPSSRPAASSWARAGNPSPDSPCRSTSRTSMPGRRWRSRGCGPGGLRTSRGSGPGRWRRRGSRAGRRGSSCRADHQNGSPHTFRGTLPSSALRSCRWVPSPLTGPSGTLLSAAGVTGSPRLSSQPRPPGAARSALPAHNATRTTMPGPARRAETAPRTSSNARQPTARSPSPNSQGSATADPGEEAYFCQAFCRQHQRALPQLGQPDGRSGVHRGRSLQSSRPATGATCAPHPRHAGLATP